MKVIIFSGPTISCEEIHHLLPNAVTLPPAAQGDVYLATKEEPCAIGLIDGYFHQVPSVWHKEIMWAIHKGIRVYGAASMGALRAAELHRFGMIGVGEIFEAYKTGELEDDDEVAILHAPPEAGFLACSDAMVDIRWTLRAARVDGVISPDLSSKLEAYAKTLHYSQRTFHRIFSDLVLQPELARLSAWLAHGRVLQKKIDAIALCRAIHLADKSISPPSPVFGFERTLHWVQLTNRLDRGR
jgi:hypothetical protein